MGKSMYKLFVLFISLFLTSLISSAQEKRCITEIYSVEKSQSKSYVRELELYLKSKGLYDNKKSRETITSSIKGIKKKLQIGNIDFTRGNIFIVELLGGKIYEDPEEWCEGFGIIEIGFSTEQQAVDIFKKAKMASQKYTMNIPIYRPPFRCVRVGKSVLFVYSINVNMDKYLDLVESWQPLKCESPF